MTQNLAEAVTKESFTIPRLRWWEKGTIGDSEARPVRAYIVAEFFAHASSILSVARYRPFNDPG
jgi:hypothetical protein